MGVGLNVMTQWLIQDLLRPSYGYESLDEVVKEDEEEECRRQYHHHRMDMFRRQDFRSTADPGWDDDDIILLAMYTNVSEKWIKVTFFGRSSRKRRPVLTREFQWRTSTTMMMMGMGMT